MKNIIKKLTSFVLSFAMVIGMFVGFPMTRADAAVGSKEVSCWYFYNKSSGSWYWFNYGGMNGGIPKLTVDDQVAYCVQPNVAAGGGTPNVTLFNGASWNEVLSSITSEQKRLVDLALSYGYARWASADEDYTNRFAEITPSSTDDIERIATQLVIWAILEGWFDNSSESTALNAFTADMSANGVGSAVRSAYDTIKSDIVGHPTKFPSFSSSSTENKLEYNSATKKWSITLTDSNYVSDKYDWDEAIRGYSYLSVSRSGNKVTFTSTKEFSTITLSVPIANSRYNAKSAVLLSSSGTKVQSWDSYGAGNDGINRQACSTYEPTTPDKATVKLFAEQANGDLKIKKTSEDGKVSGITFTVKQGSKVIGTYTTNNDGYITIPDLAAGLYTVTETEPNGYHADAESKTVTVKAGETAEVSFKNSLDRGSLNVTKTFSYKDGVSNKDITSTIADAIVNDITFTLKGTSTTGQTINESRKLVKKNGNYVASFENIPVGTYTLSEVAGTTASKYVVPVKDSTVTITYSSTAGNKSVNNDATTGNLQFKKEVEYLNVNTIQFNLKGTADNGMAVDMTVNVANRVNGKVLPWMGTINGVKKYYTSEVTVQNGVVKFSNVPVGTYTLTESRVNDCFIPMETKTNVKIVAGKTVDYTGTVNGNAIVENDLKRGGLQVIKHSENGVVEGLQFRLNGQSQSGMNVDLVAVTDKNGIAEFKEVPIGSNYVLTEVNTPAHFIPGGSMNNIVIEWDRVNNVSLPNRKDVYNWDKRGDLVLTKTIENSKYPENNTLSGFKFRLHGTSDSGETVDITKLTDEKGIITFNDVLIGTYTIEEVDTPERYIIPEPQTVSVYWNGKDHDGKIVNQAQANIPCATVKFENKLKYFSVEIVKIDSEKTIPQGEATLSGAVYGIYDNGVLIDSYTTDENGKFTTKEYECGYKWTMKEISSSEGYLLDETVYRVGAEPKLYTERNNTAPIVTTTEDVSKGKFLILKTTGNGTGVYEFEEGAEFEVYLTEAGSYATANEYERDYLTIGADGTATTKDLPYGNYTIHQTKAWEGRAFADDYTVFVGKQNGSFSMIPINNGSFEARIRVLKVDGDVQEGQEPKAIPIEGAAFQIYDPHGNLVVQKITYPNYMEFDTFYTNADGEFTIPEPLPYGEGYSLVEVAAPYGYVLSNEPMYFNVTALDADLENGYATIVVTFKDYPQKGSIKVDKLGEVFSSVTQVNGYYQPQYSVEHLQGAVYSIVAVEDIYTPDGTLRYVAGDEVDRITTGEDGSVTSKPLYLGKYNVIEVESPYGMTLDSTPMSVELVYGDQLIEILDDTAVAQVNDRQRLALSMLKSLETNELFGIGTGDEILSVSFGLYASEDMTAMDGTMIPKDGLIESKFCNNDGMIIFDSDLPFGKYYVKEISSDKSYILNEEKFEFTFEYQNQDIKVVEITVNNGEAIPNDLIYGLVGGIKVDAETGKGLSGAVIGLFPESAEVFTKETAYMVTTSDVEGRFAFENIPYGSYVVKELSAPERYVLNDTPFTVTIKEDGDEEYIIIDDMLIKGGIELIKVDADNPDKHLSGAEFGVWLDVNEDGAIDDEDLYIGVLVDVNGVYSCNDLKYGTYLVKEVKAPEGYILDEGVYNAIVSENGAVCRVSNNPEGTFSNKHKPEIGTTATVDGEKSTVAGGVITIDDIVAYKHLYTDRDYTVTGIIMDKVMNKPFLVNGEEVKSSVTFRPGTPDGEVVVSFTFDSSFLSESTDLVVFESLFEGDYEWAVHTDIEDEGQTVTLKKPTMKTTATSNGDKEEILAGTVTIVDTVEYSGLVKGKEYTVEGTLMDKGTGDELLINNRQVTAKTTFIAEEEDGFVSVTFEFDVSGVSNDIVVVVFERMNYNGREFMAHTDINDDGQTVKLRKPTVGTKATINADLMKETKTFVVDDEVLYGNLIVGREYLIKGILMDKETGKPYTSQGKIVESEAAFVAENSDGNVIVRFVFDTDKTDGEVEVVVFEKLYYKGMEIASHEDINSKDQSVSVYSLKDDEPPHGGQNPPTGIRTNTWAGILCTTSVGLMCLTKKKKSGRKHN